MHIPDGILPLSVCAAGYAVTGATTWYSLRKINQQEDPQANIPKAALLASAFFVASWIHIPVPPVSVHLILNGMMGVVLGWYAFPAILIGLFFQAIMFNHGGLTTLGVNAAMMGIPALLAYGVFQLRYKLGPDSPKNLAIFAFLGGALGLGLAAAIAFPTLIYTIPGNIDAAAEQASIAALMIAHIPLMFIEGVFTAMLVSFLYRVKPELIKAMAT
jgi:cobalt/nickel transport system permease protein